MPGRKYSFQKPTQFSKGNNVLEAAAYNINGFFAGMHGFLQLTSIGLICGHTVYLHVDTPKLQEILRSKIHSTFTRNKVLNAAACSIHGFRWGGKSGTSTELNRCICHKHSLLHLETAKLQEAYLSKRDTVQTGNRCAR
jgi:hypothetical protein